jgi:hypothetical protein
MLVLRCTAMVMMHMLLVLIVLKGLPNVRMFGTSSEIHVYIDDHVIVLVFLDRGRACRLEHMMVVVAVSTLRLGLSVVSSDPVSGFGLRGGCSRRLNLFYRALERLLHLCKL